MLEQITTEPPASIEALLWVVALALAVAVGALWRMNGAKNQQITELYQQLFQTQTEWREAERRHAQEMFEAARAAELTGQAFQKAIEALRSKPKPPC